MFMQESIMNQVLMRLYIWILLQVFMVEIILSDIVKKTVKDVYVPITVGGGIRSIDDVKFF